MVTQQVIDQHWSFVSAYKFFKADPERIATTHICYRHRKEWPYGFPLASAVGYQKVAHRLQEELLAALAKFSERPVLAKLAAQELLLPKERVLLHLAGLEAST
jgi:hypothetical protein